MHRAHHFKFAASLAAALTITGVAMHAQAQAPQASGASRTAQTSGSPSSEDTMFAQKAATSGTMEVQHGQLAASKATNAQVKAFANQLVKDHTAANDELMAIAKRKNITLPTHAKQVSGEKGSIGARNDATTDTKTGAGVAKGGNATGTTGASGTVATTGEARARSGQDQPWMSQGGAAFDKGFVESQVKAHQDAIALFEKQANSGSDSDLKAFAGKHLPGLKAHLKQAQDLQGTLGARTY